MKSGLKRLKRIVARHPHAGLILAAFISLAVIYSLVTPPFEAGDESRHYAVVKYMADTGRLPVQNVPPTQDIQHHWSHEGNQPPLYYALAATLTAWIDTGSWDDVFWYNLHTTIGNPLRPDNKNITIHPPGEDWPWRGHVFAVHLIRFLSIAMAGVTVITAYLIALRLFRDRWLAAGAMAITAFNPMFIFISSAINNDNAVIMFVTLTLYQLTMSNEQLSINNEQLTKSFILPISPAPLSNPLPRPDPPLLHSSTPPLLQPSNANPSPPPRTNPPHLKSSSPSTRPSSTPPALQSSTLPTFRSSTLSFSHILLLGLLIGLGALSKLYAFGLLPLSILVFIWIAYRQASQRERGRSTPFSSGLNHIRVWQKIILWSAVLLIVFTAVAGWFYVRNALLYNGDFFALETMRVTAGQRREGLTLATLRAEFEGFRIAYWALFGGVNILADRWIYTVLDAVSIIALAGLAVYLIKITIYSLSLTKFSTIPQLTNPSTTPASRSPNLLILQSSNPSITPASHSSTLPLPQSANPPAFQPSNPPILHSSNPPLSHLPTLLILLAWAAIMVAGFIIWNLTQPAGQGRLLYPAIAAISALGMLGLTWWLPTQNLQRLVAIGCAIGLFFFAAVAPFAYIAPAYAKPPVLTAVDLPADLQPIDLIYDDTVRLIGYQLDTPIVRPAETVRLTLFWQIVQPTPINYSVFIHILGRNRDRDLNRDVVGQIDTYPGAGAWPTTLLSPGDILADTYEITIQPEAEFSQAPTRLQIAAGIYDFNEPGRPGRAAVNAAGQPVDPIISSAKLIPWQWPEPERRAQPINFIDKAQLLNYRITDDQQSVTLTWQVTARFEADYTVFLQAWRSDTNAYVTGFDGPPVQNNYPTSLWAPGEIIIDTHSLDLTQLPPGDYKLLAGLYDPANGERLPAFGPDGPLPDFAVNLGQFTVSE